MDWFEGSGDCEVPQGEPPEDDGHASGGPSPTPDDGGSNARLRTVTPRESLPPEAGERIGKDPVLTALFDWLDDADPAALPTLADAAARVGRKRSTIERHLAAAGLPPFERLLVRWSVSDAGRELDVVHPDPKTTAKTHGFASPSTLCRARAREFGVTLRGKRTRMKRRRRKRKG